VPEVMLAVDTSTPVASVAVSRAGVLLGEILLNSRIPHSDRLLCLVQQLLNDCGLSVREVDAFALAIGPGSFTGLRVGMATVKGLALATGKPVAGISSLRMLAMQAPAPLYPVCSLFDARKKQVYAGFFRWQNGFPQACRPEVVLAPQLLLDSVDEPTIFVGDGAQTYRQLIVERLGAQAHFLPFSHHLCRASHLLPLAVRDLEFGKDKPLAELIPNYVRRSEAELLFGPSE
jgi:tRNA threonylcarbamoyladenosine biosynthesis protein TsaB